jgi:transcriptional regulator with XRE-family HTH domain
MATRDVDWPLGDVIKRARERLGLSVRAAAKLMDVSPTTWSSVETGTRVKRGGGGHEPAQPQASVIIAAARIVRVDVDTALRLAGYEPSVYNPASAAPLTRSERTVAQRVSMLSPEQQAAVGTVVDAFLGRRAVLSDDPPDEPADEDASPTADPQSVFQEADPQHTGPADEARPPGAAQMSGHEAGRRHAQMSGHEHGKTRGPDDVPEPRVAGRS